MRSCLRHLSAAGRILVVDDEPHVRRAIALILRDAGFIAEEAGDASQGSACLERDEFDLVLADLRMPGNERSAWLRQLAREWPELPVIVLTGAPCMESAIDAIGLTVRAYLLKPVLTERLIAEIHRARATNGRGELSQMRRRVLARSETWALSPRQAQVLELLAGGAANKTIAARLGCTPRTVEDHVGALLKKSGADSRTALVARFWGRAAQG